jgi:hypothetical protein
MIFEFALAAIFNREYRCYLNGMKTKISKILISIMTQDIHINRKKNQPTKGKTDYARLRSMTEPEIEENAKNDPDAPLIADEDMKKFKHVKPKDWTVEKKIVMHHISGQKHHGKTDWAKVLAAPNKIVIDSENPELTYKKTFKKVQKD